MRIFEGSKPAHSMLHRPVRFAAEASDLPQRAHASGTLHAGDAARRQSLAWKERGIPTGSRRTTTRLTMGRCRCAWRWRIPIMLRVRVLSRVGLNEGARRTPVDFGVGTRVAAVCRGACSARSNWRRSKSHKCTRRRQRRLRVPFAAIRRCSPPVASPVQRYALAVEQVFEAAPGICSRRRCRMW